METEGMRSLRSTLAFAILLGLALAACAPASTPAVATPSLVPVDLAGPEMTIGSTWLYADGTLLVAVPAGIFTMGGGKTDNLAHPVNLPDFWIYRTKVTNVQYGYCVGLGGCTAPNGHDNPGFDDYLRANDPVIGVDYSQAGAYCAFVHARLPTEAEWEKAARGPDAIVYPWGNDPPNCDRLNYGICKGKTTPVNAYPQGQSYYKAFDMEGNALEWVADWYDKDYYPNSPADDPQGPEKGRARVVRSSAFNSGGDRIPVYTRSFSSPDTHRNNLGFRCVVDDPDYFSPFCQYPAIYGTDEVGGTSSGPQVQVDCPDISIDQNPTCNGNLPVTYVSINGLANLQIWSIQGQGGNCQNTGAFTYSCSTDGLIKACSECEVTVTVPPQCPSGYSYDAASKHCIGTGTPGACLPGSTPISTSGGQCCTFEPGTAAPTAEPLSQSQSWVFPGGFWSFGCPPGTWHYFSPPDHDECIPVPVQSPYCVSANIALLSCTSGGGGGGGNTCNITEQSCAATCNPLGYIYDAAACSCNCNAG